MTLHPAFDLVSDRHLPELDGAAWRVVHRRTGAEVVIVRNADRNNLFAVTFATLSQDDTGVAHILEHMVFRGSRSYPLSQPFAGLLQGSLQTYLNASTGPDSTTFHLASQNQVDLGNLIDVTLDAVLRPLLRQEHFEEEGWHVALVGPKSGLRIGGIVLTEMMGFLAAPLNAIEEEVRRTLFPGTVYARAHGGDPARIPDLTHAELVAFHRRHYHPSNARIFLWGDGDVDARLDQIDRHFEGFEGDDPAPPVRACPPFAAPRFLVDDARGQGLAGGSRDGFVMLAWALPREDGLLGPLGWPLLVLALLDLPGAPLAEALRRARLGRGLIGKGLVTAHRQPMFSIGLQGTEPSDAAKVEGLAFDTLARIAADGFEAPYLAAALASLELSLQESASGLRPRGLVVLDRVLGGWRHGADPLALLNHAASLARLRDGLAAGQSRLRDMIQANLLGNPHRVTLAWAPDPSAGERLRAAHAGRLAAIEAGLTPKRRAALLRKTASLGQAKSEAAAARGCLPSLSRSDLPRQVTRVPTEVSGPVVRMDLGEGDILRVDVLMDLAAVPAELLGLVPLFARALIESGVVTSPPRSAQLTGGLTTATWAGSGPSGPAAFLALRGKALASASDDLFGSMATLLGSTRVAEPALVARLIEEEIARQEARLLSSGHQVVDLRLRAGSGLAGAMADRLDGLGQLGVLRSLRSRMATSGEGVLADLATLWAHLLDPSRLTVGLAGTEDIEPAMSFIADVARLSLPTRLDFSALPIPATGHEAHVVALPVQSVGRAADLRLTGLPATGAMAVGACALSTGWLWDAVRVAGGAYGAKAVLDRQTGVLSFLSFRDPHVLRTIDVYGASGAWLRREASPDLVNRCIIGAVAEADRPLRPEALAVKAVQWHLTGLTDDYRQAELEAVLSAGVSDLLALADALDAALPEGPIVVLGSEAALRAALGERPGAFAIMTSAG